MQRNVDINEISDGKKYTINDMAKIGCNDCSGCSKCCENMKGLITLDPYDIYRILDGLNQLIVCEIDNQIVVCNLFKGVAFLCGSSSRAAKHGFDSRKHLFGFKGFCYIIVSTQFKTENLIKGFAFCREHDNRFV